MREATMRLKVGKTALYKALAGAETETGAGIHGLFALGVRSGRFRVVPLNSVLPPG